MKCIPYVIYENDENGEDSGEEQVDFSKFMDFVLDEESKKKCDECDKEEEKNLWKKSDDENSDTASNKTIWR